MFHNVHTYVTLNLYQSDESLLILGSILPDLAVTGIIKWEGGLHGKESVANFSQFIRQYPEYTNLYQGVLSHNIVDDFTHQNYHGEPGFAYQNNKELVQLVKKFYGLNDKEAEGKAHNYIESGVDILLLKEYPKVQEQLRKVVNQVDKQKLAKLLGSYFDIDEEKFLKALDEFFTLFTKYDFSLEDDWVLFWRELEELLSLKDIGTEKRKILLTKSIQTVENTYQDFLQYAISAGLKQIENLQMRLILSRMLLK